MQGYAKPDLYRSLRTHLASRAHVFFSRSQTGNRKKMHAVFDELPFVGVGGVQLGRQHGMERC